ncbi:MAG: hydroxyacid dehydrogenase [Desulfovibrio sp.]|nr:MAG: D-isomer specific 2-hydroxyacid [Desulfovibrionaceae bacterium]MBA4356772.1 hydroxyacid dehydrogenase [Desulfovibrio sp.]
MKEKPLAVITHWIHPEVADFLAQHCRLLLNETRDSLPRSELLARLDQADAAMMFMPDWVDQELLDHAPQLKVIGAALKGFDNYDVEAITNRGIWLTNVPDLLTVPTAELAIGLLLSLGRNFRQGDHLVMGGKFQGWRPTFYGTGVQGSTVGIIGLGRLGQAVAERLQGWGARLLGHDVNPLTPERAEELRVEQTGLDELLCRSDFVLLLTPLTGTTRHLLGAEKLSLMKPGSCLISAGRGSCVDEMAVSAALRDGRLAGYAADVFEFEDWALPGRPDVIPPSLLSPDLHTFFTPHLGSAVEEVRRAIALEAAQNIVEALQGRRPHGAVNSPIRASAGA